MAAAKARGRDRRPASRSASTRSLELRRPFDALGVAVDQPVQFYVELLQADQSRDRAPREGTIALTRPSADFEQIMWDV